MDHAARAGDPLEVEPVEELLGRVPEPFAAAERDRRDGDMHRVDEVGVEELPDCGDAAADPYVLAVGGVQRLRERVCGVASRKWNVVSASVNEGRT